jgi:hypothetical protein
MGRQEDGDGEPPVTAASGADAPVRDILMSRGDLPPRGGTSARTRPPRLATLAVVALGYQQSAHVPPQVTTALHIGISLLAGVLLSQLTVHAGRAVAVGVHTAIDWLREGEWELRLSRTEGRGTRRADLERTAERR